MPFMKLLQNKTVVSCLAVAAALFVAGQFVQWPDRKSIAAAARPPAAPPVELVTYTVPNTPARTSAGAVLQMNDRRAAPILARFGRTV